MSEFVSPEYQEQLDGLSETLRQAGETREAEVQFDRVFLPRIPLSFFEDTSEALEPGFIQHRFEDLQ